MMNWSHLLSTSRLGKADSSEQQNRAVYLQDLDRIAFSAPFRRLANKTQVHPLHEHDHVHHRLIHSMETASVGRSLGMSAGDWLEQEGQIQPGEKHTVSGMVQAACMAHDIGNPAFGHSGEEAIGQWFAAKFGRAFDPLFTDLPAHLRPEFEAFEGNAQGFRILTRLEMYRNEGGMQLSHGVLGTFTKYGATADVQTPLATAAKDKGQAPYCGLKKFGVFHSEAAYFADVAQATGLMQETSANGSWFRRHPLVFLVEAADDICYNICDIEDAYTTGDLDFQTVLDILTPLLGKPNHDASAMTQAEYIAYLRARGINAAVAASIEAFKSHHDKILAGQFNSSLIEQSDKAQEFSDMVDLARSKIFTGRRKTEMEVYGRNVVHKVLDGITPVFTALRALDWTSANLTSKNGYGYEAQLVRALELDLRDVNDSYSALHALADFASGMTDRYAVRVAGML